MFKLEKYNYITLKEVYNNIDDYILLTSSQILTNHYTNHLNMMAAKETSTFWHKMPVFHLNLWIQKLYKNLDHRSPIANQTHKIMLTYNIIRTINQNMGAKKAMQLAKKINTTINYCNKWKITQSAISMVKLSEHHDIQKVAIKLKQELTKQHLIDETGIINAITTAIETGKIKITQSIVLVGFEYLDPTTLDLIKTLASHTNVFQLDYQPKKGTLNWLESKNAKHAYYDFAAWHKTLPAKAKVGFFAPNINDPELMRYIALSLNTHHVANDAQPIYHINNHQSIGIFDIIASALLLLKLTTTTIRTTEIIQILLSHHLFGTDLKEKAELSHWLEQKIYKYEEYISIENLLKMLISAQSVFVNGTITSLISIIEFIIRRKNPTKLSAHINDFKQILRLAKWPILQHENEQKIALEFANILHNLMDNSTRSDADEAYDIITEIVTDHQILFTNNNADIQIHDIVTGSFLDYDYIWVANLNNCSWPRYHQAKSFLNQSIIEQYNIYSKSNQISIAENAISRIASNSIICIYNYASIRNEIAASPTYMITNIIANNPKLNLNYNMPNDYAEFCSKNITEIRPLEQNVALLKQEHSINTYTVKDFNTCNFKSFARFRLFAKELDPPSLGLRSLEKGIIIHSVLQNIYSEIKHLHEFKNITPDEIQKLAYSITFKNMQQVTKHKPYSTSQDFLTNESNKIAGIITAWIQQELERDNCKIHAIEQEVAIKISNITIKGVIDRVDKLDNNKYVIIDYKTGMANANSWFNETISEPQMPIYSIAYSNNIAATCYAHLKHNNVGYSGIAADDSYIPQLKTPKNIPEKTIDELVMAWHNSIEKTLTTYAQGSIKTITSNISTECNKCPYSGVCRIWEKSSNHV